MNDIQKGNILIIDDDEGVVRTIIRAFKKLDTHLDYSYNLTEGLKKIDDNDFDVIFLDVNLPDGNGIEKIPYITERISPPLVIIMTAYSDPDGAELAIENGAWDYLQKPVSSKDLKLQLTKAFKFQDQKKQNSKTLKFEAPSIIGRSTAIQKCLTQASQIVYSDANVLINGETGTGKELFAKAIHDNSARRNGEFVVVDCSVLTDNLIESVLFGHEKGAFTGADRDRKGLVALANGGTLFLDEVGELPESIQSSFLRVLQEKKFRPVGSEKQIYSDFRVISATNKNLEAMVQENCFRMDLIYRLKTFILNLPPLRERREDILKIAKYQIKKRCKEHHLPNKEIALDFVEILEKYDWPGNVRELMNTIEISVTSAQFENTLFAFHLPAKIRAKITRLKITKGQNKSVSLPENDLFQESLTHKELISKTEHKYLESLFRETNGDIQQLLKRSGLSRTVLYRKIKEFGIK